DPASGFQTNNAELMDILGAAPATSTNLFNTLNPRKTQFFNAKMAATANMPGLGPDGVLRDLWSKPYIVTLDLNYDNLCSDGFYSQLMKSFLGKALDVPGSIIIWSLGPDTQLNSDTSAGGTGQDPRKYKENKDNVLSWE